MCVVWVLDNALSGAPARLWSLEMGDARSAATACEAWYAAREPRGWCNCLTPKDKATERIDLLLSAMQPNVTSSYKLGRSTCLRPARRNVVAVLLRGGAPS